MATKKKIPLPKSKPPVPKRKGYTSMSIEDYFKDPENKYKYGADRTSGLKPAKKKKYIKRAKGGKVYKCSHNRLY